MWISESMLKILNEVMPDSIYNGVSVVIDEVTNKPLYSYDIITEGGRPAWIRKGYPTEKDSKMYRLIIVTEIAKNLLGINLPLEQIFAATGLSVDEIKKLKSN